MSLGREMCESPCFKAATFLTSKLVFRVAFLVKNHRYLPPPHKKILIALVLSLAETSAYSCLSLPQVVAVYGTLSDLLSVASNKLGIKATSVYNGKGGLIDDIALIR